MLNSILKVLKSRTVISLLIMIAVNVVNVIGQYLSTEQLTLINGILGALAVYYRVNPKQKY